MAGNRSQQASPGAADSNARARLMRTSLRRWLGRGLDLVYPPVCAYCLGLIETGSSVALCPRCRAALAESRPACPRCAASAPALGNQRDCPACQRRRFYFGCATRLGTYQDELRSAVLRIKRSSGRPLAAALGDLLAESAASRLAPLQVDVVVPVPMHWTRKALRGVNSAEGIARRLATHLHIPMRPGLLKRCRRTAPQASLPHSRRRANVRGAFRAGKYNDLPGARVLLVDDIMTSGATVNEAARTLSKSGAGFVAVAVLARAAGLD